MEREGTPAPKFRLPPVRVGVQQGDVESVRRILDGISRNMMNDNDRAHAANFIVDGKRVLFDTIENGHPELLQLILEYGADPNRTVPRIFDWGGIDVLALNAGVTCLARGSSKNEKSSMLDRREEVTKILLSAATDPSDNSKSWGASLCLLCCSTSEIEIGRRLRLCRGMLEAGVDPNLEWTIGNSFPWSLRALPLHFACALPFSDENRMGLISLLLEHGADPSLQTQEGGKLCDAFQIAIARRDPRIMELLLCKHSGCGAVDTVNSNGASLLYVVLADSHAFSRNSVCRECAILLLKFGANLDIANKWGHTPRMLLDNRVSKYHGALGQLVTKSKQKPPSFWDCEEVAEFVGKQQKGRQCGSCATWADLKRRSNDSGSSGFRQCSGCHKEYYCSKECQREHWRYHKKHCILKVD